MVDDDQEEERVHLSETLKQQQKQQCEEYLENVQRENTKEFKDTETLDRDMFYTSQDTKLAHGDTVPWNGLSKDFVHGLF